MTTTLTPSGITVNNSLSNYVFSGIGRLSGTAGLVKNGSGILTLSETGIDNFSGGIQVNNGTVVLDNLNATLSGGSSVSAGGTLQVNRIAAFSGNAVINGSLNLNPPSPITVTNPISGTGIVVKQGASTVQLLPPSTNLMNVSILATGGTLRAGNSNALGSTQAPTTILSGATLDINAQNLGAEPIIVSGSGVGGLGAIVNNTATQQLNAVQFVTLAGNTTFGGVSGGRWDIRSTPITSVTTSLSTGGNPYKLTKVGGNQFSLVGVNVDPALGDIDVQQGTFSVEKVTTSLGNAFSNLTVFSGATLQFFQVSNVLNKIVVLRDGASIFNSSGLNTFGGPIILSTNSSAGAGNCTFNISGNYLYINSGLISGPGNLIKTGSSTLFLSGNQSYTGSTLINAGTLALYISGTISSSPLINVASGAILDASQRSDRTLTLAGGQTLRGNGTLAGKVLAGAGSVVAAGASETAFGNLTVAEGLTLQGTTVLKVNATSGTNDQLRAGNIIYGGTLNVTNLAGALANGSTFKLFNAANYSGSFIAMQPVTPGPGLIWDTTDLPVAGVLGVLATNALAIYQQPEPFISRFVGGSLTISVLAGSSAPLTYQWLFDGTNPIPAATSASYTLNGIQLSDAGKYSCVVSNQFGSLISSNSVLTVVPPTNSYPVTVLADNPLGYWRLNEGNGSAPAAAGNGAVAYDYIAGHNGAYTTNVQLGVAGYTPSDPDTAASFGTLAANNSYVNSISGIDFSQQGPNAEFSVEVWVHAGRQTVDNGIVTVGYGSGGEQFDLDANGAVSPSSRWRFFVRDSSGNTHAIVGTNAPNGDWHHVVGVCDQTNGTISLYVDGLLQGTASIPAGLGVLPANTPMSIGSRKNGFNSTSPDMQFNGVIDEVSLYNYPLTASKVLAHYQAGGGGQAPPSIVAQPQNAPAAEGWTGTLTVTAKGAEPLAYQWQSMGTNLVDGVRISGAHSNNLSIANLQQSDSKGYQVIITNSYGAITSTLATLSVAPATTVYSNNFQGGPGSGWSNARTNVTPLGARTFLGDFSSGTVSLNLSNLPPHLTALVTFDLLILQSWDGNTPSIGPDIWDLSVGGGQTLLHTTFGNTDANGERQAYPGTYPGGDYPSQAGALEANTLGYLFYGDSVYHLSFAFIHVSDVLTLNFSASGLQTIGDESWGLDNVQVALASPVTIFSQPVSQTVVISSNVSFSVGATGLPAPAYQWQFNGANLAGATDSTLSINNVKIANGGSYRVVVTNAYSSVTSAVATLAILTKPVILQSPASAQVTEGGSVTFTVVASSSGPLSYQWLFNSGNIAGATRSTYSVVGAQSSDSGNYSALVTNAAGSALSSSASLLVVPAPPPPPAQINYTLNIRTGLNLIANQLDKGGNTLGEIMPLVPAGCVLSKFDNASGTWSESTFNSALGAWVPSSITLSPGEGAFLKSPTNFSLTFSGLPHVPVLPVTIPNGSAWLLSRQTNDIGTFENITGVDPSPGAIVYRWNNSNATYNVFTYGAGGWSNGVAPIAEVGEALWIAPAGGSPVPIPEAPFITQQPISLVVTQGDSATFTVAATGTEPLSYQWRLNGNIIPGATSNVFTIANVQPGNAGNYSVAIDNLIGSVDSTEAALGLANLPILPFADNFNSAGNLGSVTNGIGTGSNVGATTQGGEPAPDFIPGGASIWLKWQPQLTGIATMTTAGSGFDTVMAIYSGSSLGNLVFLAGDDDSAPFLCSQVSFNVVAGTTYYIQVDGFHGVAGSVLLSWNLAVTANQTPVILTQPLEQTVPAGADVTLSVTVQAGPPVTYQWFLGDAPLPGANDATLFLPGVGPENVGFYRVEVTNPQNLSKVSSIAVSVEIIAAVGNTANIHPADKFSAATSLTLPDPNVPRDPTFSGGFTGTQLFSNTGATADFGEPFHCGYPPCHSVWYSYQAQQNGLLRVYTTNNFSGILEVYTGPGNSFTNLVPVACSANHGASGESVLFTVTSNTLYWIVFDGVNCSNGTFSVSYNLGAVPSLATAPLSQTVANGGNITLTAAASGSPPFGYQWRLNGSELSGGTGSAFTITNFRSKDEGTYTVVLSNAYGTNESGPAFVYLNDPARFFSLDKLASTLSMKLAGIARSNYVLEVSSNLVNWSPLRTNNSSTGIIPITESIDSASTPRFYRTRKL